MDPLPSSKRSNTAIWTRDGPIFCIINVHAVSLSILDGPNHTQHVRHYPWCVDPFLTLQTFVHYDIVNLSTYFMVDRASNSTLVSSKRITSAIALLTFVGVVLRAEVVLFLGPLSLQLLMARQISLFRLLKVGVISALLSLCKTFSLYYPLVA